MRAFVITGPGEGAVLDVDEPETAAGQVVVAVERVGLCGTDVELFSGAMPYLHDGHARYPLRPGHEWVGRVAAVGDGVDPSWLGALVTGDTMLGCGRCDRCRAGRHHVCADRYEIGIRGGWPGALAERLPVPAGALRRLPAGIPLGTAAMVEPGGSAWRAVDAGRLQPGQRACIFGPGTIGLLATQFAVAAGASVDVVGLDDASLAMAIRVGASQALRPEEVAPSGYDVAIDATSDPSVPARLVELVEPAGRVVLVGVADAPSLADLRHAVLRDVTVVGILAASRGLDRTIELYASGRVDPEPLIAATVGLDDVAAVLAGRRPAGPPGAPKIQVDPRH